MNSINLEKEEIAALLNDREVVKDEEPIEWVKTISHHYDSGIEAYKAKIIFKFKGTHYVTCGFEYKYADERPNVSVQCDSDKVTCYEVEQVLEPRWRIKVN